MGWIKMNKNTPYCQCDEHPQFGFKGAQFGDIWVCDDCARIWLVLPKGSIRGEWAIRTLPECDDLYWVCDK